MPGRHAIYKLSVPSRASYSRRDDLRNGNERRHSTRGSARVTSPRTRSADDAALILVTDDRREGHDLISRTYTPWDELPRVTDHC